MIYSPRKLKDLQVLKPDLEFPFAKMGEAALINIDITVKPSESRFFASL